MPFPLWLIKDSKLAVVELTFNPASLFPVVAFSICKVGVIFPPGD